MTGGRSPDEELADAWEACRLGRGISHAEHLRIARVLLRRHGREGGGKRVLEGTRRNCEAMGGAERFDEGLTERWVSAIADAIDRADAASFEEFVRLHPELSRSDAFGLPAWKLTSTDI